MPAGTDPFRSSRLIYRAVEPAFDEAFILECQQSSVQYQNYNCAIPVPKNMSSTQEFLRNFQTDRLLSVIICLPRDYATDDEPVVLQTVPIGVLTLTPPDAARRHHRRALIGLFILDKFQNQGYGGEAIRWCLQWGFERAGLHRIGIECVSWSEGLLRLYQRIGFTVEGRSRDFYWFEGKWWDYYQLAMLEDEWRSIRDESSDWKIAS